MRYDHTITLTIDLSHLETAKRISRALDPDVGGYNAFQQRSEDGTRATYSTPCTESFATNAAMLLMVPEELLKVVEQDYFSRWPDLTPPSLDEIIAFCSDVECFIS